MKTIVPIPVKKIHSFPAVHTLTGFCSSLKVKKSSMYDVEWSVAPESNSHNPYRFLCCRQKDSLRFVCDTCGQEWHLEIELV